jgi:hypothetical protein
LTKPNLLQSFPRHGMFIVLPVTQDNNAGQVRDANPWLAGGIGALFSDLFAESVN